MTDRDVTTDTDHQAAAFDWQGYRPVPGWQDYVMNPRCHVWSLPREVAGKNGSTRSISARLLKPSAGRVYLCANGNRQRVHAERELFPVMFPDLVEHRRRQALQRPQYRCKNGHPLIDPLDPAIFGSVDVTAHTTHWGSGNRICLRCNRLVDHADTYSRHSGVHGRQYRGLPQRELYRDRDLINDLYATAHGFKVSAKP